MRILHTADWHLGKRLSFYSRLEEQREVLKEIITIAAAQEVDMVIVAGDLFDTGNPSNEATELLYKTLKQLARNATVPVIAIAGNHDSPDRVNVADVLARENGIILIGHPTDTVPDFTLETGMTIQHSEAGFFEIRLPQIEFPIRLLHTAFANEVRLKEYFGEDKQASLQDCLSKRWAQLSDKFCDEQGVNILTTHLYMLQRGGAVLEEPDGEKPLNIGNADVVYTDAIPSQIQYTALGHLHRNHSVGVHQPVEYSGSPIAYSFAEAGQTKYVAIIDLLPGQPAAVQHIPLEKGKSLARKTFTNVEDAIEWLSENQDALVELTLETTEFISTEERKRINQTHNGIIHLIPKVKNLTAKGTNSEPINLSQDILSLFKDYFKSKNSGQEPNEEQLSLFQELLNQEDAAE